MSTSPRRASVNGHGGWRVVLVAVMVSVLGACSTTDWQARAVSVPMGAEVPDGAMPAYQRGKAHLTAGNFGLALEAFNQAERREPGSVATLNAIAITYGKLGRLDMARRHFERALALDPDAAPTLNNFGRALLEHDRATEALALFERALELERDNPTIAANTATARRRVAQRRAEIRKAEAAQPAAPPTAWIERSSARLQTLITADVARAGAETVDPRLANVFGAEASPGAAGAVEGRASGARERQASPSIGARLEVSNGAGRRRMAARMRRYLTDHGLQVDRLTNADWFGYRRSTILYRPGFETLATRLAGTLPFEPALEEDPNQWSAVRLRLGADLLEFDATLPRES